MEKYEIYRLIHFTGIFILLFAFGSLFTGEKSTKAAAVGHGIGLLLILLGGFGMHASPIGGPELKLGGLYKTVYGTALPTWLILKIVIWLALGASMVLAKRRIIKGATAWILIIVLAVASAWIGRKLTLREPSPGNAPATTEKSA